MTKSRRPSEFEIKAHVLSALRKQRLISGKSVVASEFRLRSSLRADLAILDDQFIGVEIKSELDSLRRLSRQISGYLAYFDHIIVVVASRHIDRLDLRYLAGADIWEVDGAGRLIFFRRRNTYLFPKKRSLFDLMTLRERKRFSLNRESPSDESDGLRSLERASFERAFRWRYGKSSEAFWTSVGRRKVAPSDLVLLDPHHEQKARQARWQEELARQELQWRQKAESYFGYAGAGVRER